MVAAPAAMIVGILLTAGIYVRMLALLRRRMATHQPIDIGSEKE